MKKRFLILIGLATATASLPAVAGPNWFIIDQERADTFKAYQARAEKNCACPETRLGMSHARGKQMISASKAG